MMFLFSWPIYPYNLHQRRKKPKYPSILGSFHNQFTSTVQTFVQASRDSSWFQNQNRLCSLVQRRASQLQQNCRLRDPHPPTSHAGLVRATLRVSAWHHATQPKCVVSLELSISSCLDSLYPHPKLLVAFYNESMEQVLTKWAVGYTWSRVPPSFPGLFCQVLDNPGWWYKATHLAGQHPSYENAECSQWT